MRIRKPFAGAFAVCLLLFGAGLLAPPASYTLPRYRQSDKLLHFLAFFAVTICFYWILETSRRKVLQFTLFICTFILGVGSEIAQGLLTQHLFDPYDILANILGSLAAMGLSSWYHKRMLERKRLSKSYAVVPGDDDLDPDLELGEGTGRQETGVMDGAEDNDEDGDNWDDMEAEGPANDGAADAAGQASGGAEEGSDVKKVGAVAR